LVDRGSSQEGKKRMGRWTPHRTKMNTCISKRGKELREPKQTNEKEEKKKAREGVNRAAYPRRKISYL